MEFVRIGEKLINRGKIERAIDRILEARVKGASQLEAAGLAGVDRSFVSRLESLGEVRKGVKIALIGFPVGNRDEVEAVAREEGVDYTLLLTDAERWEYVEKQSGLAVFNKIMQIVAEMREYDVLVFIGSDKRVELVESVIGPDIEVIALELGTSPIVGDRLVELDMLRSLLRQIREKEA